MSVKGVTKQSPDMISGFKHKTRTSGILVIVKYQSCSSVLVIFPDTGYETFSDTSSIRKGNVKDRFIPVLCGVGFIGGDFYKSSKLDMSKKDMMHGLI